MAVQPIFGGGQVVMQQPLGVQTVVQQPQGEQKIVCSLHGHRGWSSDLLDCSDENTSCLSTCLCPWFTIFQVSRRLGENPCVGLCLPGGLITLRTKERIMGGIRGSVCGDCLLVCFCGLCVICQMERELHPMGL